MYSDIAVKVQSLNNCYRQHFDYVWLMDPYRTTKNHENFRRQNIRHVNLKISLKKKAVCKRRTLAITGLLTDYEGGKHHGRTRF
ncbi:predicted protein [Methanosarcina acetivorans C2A]|uniref:Uncharacterized protein n=1 Tax=Methanosarcina acetivorans (strain ATCC 35395 / DSM 2834 / JCM 12185 / C2A) TaxID=188937 RepID=Q8THI8_METAC|nr:predicted protein [Methanosarcina acetivorans C2A]